MKHTATPLTSNIVLLTIIVILSLNFSVFSNIIFNDELFIKVRQQYGSDAEERVRDWQQALDNNKDSDVDEQLYEINSFFNELEFIDDIKHWQKTDYWATPVEFLATNAGDCEDFTIAKYFSLISMGVPSEKLRLMYVKALRLNQAHMVLAYYETPESIPLVLDNINPRILPANKRRDLLPVYSFNGEGLWLAKSQGRGQQVQSGGNNRLWEDLNRRIEQGQ
jgi:predicted transglutaminase-like cysteine proteinase